eukprot:Clim_evm4s1 gene=Clim_evmTU4s1
MVAEDKFGITERVNRLSLEGVSAVEKLRKTSAFENLDCEDDCIPCLDLEWAFASEANKIQTAKELHHVLRDIGFLCVKNHGIDPVLKDKMESIARKLFHLPDEVKQQYAGKQIIRGYIPNCTEVVGVGEYMDVRESYLPPVWADDIQELWIKEIPELKDTTIRYIDSVRGCGVKMNRLVALSLGLDEEYFNREFFWNGLGFGNEILRLNFYPENIYTNSAKGTFGLGEHTDAGWLTFLAVDGKPGLEIQHPDGTWFMPKNLTRDTVVVNQGDFVTRVTNGKYRSTTHRAHNPDGNERVTFPVFFNPNYSLTGKPIEKLMEPGEEPKYEAVTFKEHILGNIEKIIRKGGAKMPDLKELSHR